MRHLWSLVHSDRGNRKQTPYSMPLLNDRRHQTAVCTSNLWEFTVCLSIMLHTLIPGSGSWSCFLPAEPWFLLSFLYSVLPVLQLVSGWPAWPNPALPTGCCLAAWSFWHSVSDLNNSLHPELMHYLITMGPQSRPQSWFVSLLSAWSISEAQTSYPDDAGFGSVGQNSFELH